MSMWNRESDAPDYKPLAPPRPREGGGEPSRTEAVIGPAIAIRGELAGEQDLLVEGHFEGEIEIPDHQVTIGRSGRVRAEINAKVVVVDGELKGNVSAEQQVVVHASGRVQGDIKAPRVALEEGCQFKGTIDMDPVREEKPAGPDSSPPADAGRPEANRAKEPAVAGEEKGSEGPSGPKETSEPSGNRPGESPQGKGGPPSAGEKPPGGPHGHKQRRR